MTRILQDFVFLYKLGLLLLKPWWDKTAKQSLFLRIHVRASSQTKSGTRHALLISLLILRKNTDCFAVYDGITKI